MEITETQERTDYTLVIYTDGSKGDSGVGAGIVIFMEDSLTHQIQYKLHDRCSNNQAEQIAILKALETIESLENLHITQKRALIYTDSRITLDSLKNSRNHNNIIENIRQQMRILNNHNWTIHYSWVKAHVGNFGNELADNLAKAATRNDNLQTCYQKIPESDLLRELQEDCVVKWDREWQETTNGEITKSYFPTVKDRLKCNISLTGNITFLTGHGKLKSYMHRFKIIDNPLCTCGDGNQTVDHLMFECKKLEKERVIFQNYVRKAGGQWTNSKRQLLQKYKKQFIQFVQTVNLDNL